MKTYFSYKSQQTFLIFRHHFIYGCSEKQRCLVSVPKNSSCEKKMFMKTSQECYCLLNKSLNIKIHIFAHNGIMHQDISVPIILSKYNSNSLCKKITRQK